MVLPSGEIAGKRIHSGFVCAIELPAMSKARAARMFFFIMSCFVIFMMLLFLDATKLLSHSD